jgi:hypothetical protein
MQPLKKNKKGGICMKKVLLIAVLAMFASVTTLLAGDEPEKKVEPKSTTVYTCSKCPVVSLTAGKCCGEDMAAKKVLAIENGMAICCDCGADCTKCTWKDKSAAQCSCGKDVKKVSLKGKYVCEKCNVISDKEGKCPACGGDLKAVSAGKDAACAVEKAKEEPKPAAAEEAQPATK